MTKIWPAVCGALLLMAAVLLPLAYRIGQNQGLKDHDALCDQLEARRTLEILEALQAGRTNWVIKQEEGKLWDLVLPIYKSGPITPDMQETLTAVALHFRDHPIMTAPLNAMTEQDVTKRADAFSATITVSDPELANRLKSVSRVTFPEKLKRDRQTQELLSTYLNETKNFPTMPPTLRR